MSGRAFADHMGLSETAIRNAAKEGKISRGPDGLYDPVSQAAAYRANTRSDMQRNPPAQADAAASAPPLNPAASPRQTSTNEDDDDDDFENERNLSQTEYNRRLAYEKMQAMQIKNAIDLSQLIDRELVLAGIEALFLETKKTWMQFVDNYGPGIAAKLDRDAHAVDMVLNEAITTHLNQTVDRMDIKELLQEIVRGASKDRK